MEAALNLGATECVNGSETLIFGIYALTAEAKWGEPKRFLRGIVLPAGTPSRARQG